MPEIRGINRTNDYAFKRIFGSEEGKDALLGFLNAVLKPPVGRELVHVDLLDRELNPKYLLDRVARLDVLARTEDGALINIEVQVANQYNIDKRTMYYWAGLYHGQLTEGQKFSDLRKTVTINILGFNWFKDNKRYHHAFHIREDNTGELLSEDLEIHFLEPEKIKKLKRRHKDDIEAWMLYLGNLQGEEMEAIAMDNPGIRKALTIEQAFMRNKQERRMYELREKAMKDEISMIVGAMAEGEVRGKVTMAQEAICKYLEAKFGDASRALQGRVREIGKVETLDKVINKIYTVGSLEEVGTLIEGAVN
ncbi:MAG: Rpn family recombination-promoting nuclease/putative transposase [Bacillota bacterium]